MSLIESNPLHNALQQVSLQAGAYQICGFSISGLSTYIQLPELDVVFDMGECPLSAVGLNHVFLSHAHGDHSRCLMRHDSLRKMMGVDKPSVYYLPESIHALACDWIKAEALFEGVSAARFKLPELRPLPFGEMIPLEYRRDLVVNTFPVRHSIASAGFTLFNRKRKLLDEYIGLPGPEIVALKKQGIDPTREVLDAKVTYIGDCVGESLLDQAHIWNSEILFLECTFLEDDEEIMARKKGHSHIADIRKALLELGNTIATKHIILKHFSMKYSRRHIIDKVAQSLPPEFIDRVQLLV